MFYNIFVLFLLLIAVEADYYHAAVYEHAVEFTATAMPSREAALKVAKRNLNILEDQVSKAKAQQADIFVFPEYGLTGRLKGRSTANYFSEVVPNVSRGLSFCPCFNSSIPVGQEVLHRLGCIAKTYGIYLAVNMGDKQPCTRTDDNCPADGQYLYNTEVVFNREGCLVAKYHKENLFEAERLFWNQPENTEHIYFDADFGRFGLITCFDAVFKKPAIELVEQYNVTNMIFSTAWMNVYPHYASVAYHSGWARNMRVNYLSANIHNVQNRLVGSGVYGPDGIIDYTFNMSSTSGHLIVAKVPIIRNRNSATSPTGSVSSLTSKKSFKLKVFGDDFQFQPLQGVEGTVSVCDNNVCCTLKFSRSNSSEFYAIGAFDGMHTVEGTYYFEICMLARCTENYTDCGSTLADETTTVFSSFILTGSMPTKYVFPEVVTADLNFTTDWEYGTADNVKQIKGKKKAIFSVVLMGRNFDKDPDSAFVDSNEKASNSFQLIPDLIAMAVCLLTYVVCN